MGGLGSVPTVNHDPDSQDVLDGVMTVSIEEAVQHLSEFIAITIQQPMGL